jgi:hypothetical protein
MEVGQGPNWGCSAIRKKNSVMLSLSITERLPSLLVDYFASAAFARFSFLRKPVTIFRFLKNELGTSDTDIC